MFFSQNRLPIALPAITLLSLATLANTQGCYRSGLRFIDISTNPKIPMITRGFACERFQGSFPQGANKYFCSQVGQNKIEFEVRNNAGTTQSLSKDDCMAAFTIEMNACERGSEQNHGNFYYRNDPNAGPCPVNGGDSGIVM